MYIIYYNRHITRVILAILRFFYLECSKRLDNIYTKLLHLQDLGNEAPVAQLDRVADFESEGCRFESCRARCLTYISGHAAQTS